MILHEYRVHFFYVVTEHGVYGPRRMTGCHIHTGQCLRVNDAPCQTEGAEAATIFNPNDKCYTKAKGRTYALARAMKNMGLPRERRTRLWKEYVRIVGMPVKGRS